ncbi:CvpA family protein [Chitinophagaceae bacterium MMS25-I14]
MILDVIGLILIIALFIRGYRKGLIVAVFAVLALLLGIICALKLSGSFASFLLEKGWVTSGWAQIISYIILFIGVIWIVRAGGKLIEKTVEAVWLGLFNNLSGGLLYAFIATVIWSSCLWIGNHAHFFTPETIAASKTFNWFSPVAPWVFAHIGSVLPFAKGLFGDLQHFFDQVNQHMPEHVGTH